MLGDVTGCAVLPKAATKIKSYMVELNGEQHFRDAKNPSHALYGVAKDNWEVYQENWGKEKIYDITGGKRDRVGADGFLILNLLKWEHECKKHGLPTQLGRYVLQGKGTGIARELRKYEAMLEAWLNVFHQLRRDFDL